MQSVRSIVKKVVNITLKSSTELRNVMFTTFLTMLLTEYIYADKTTILTQPDNYETQKQCTTHKNYTLFFG